MESVSLCIGRLGTEDVNVTDAFMTPPARSALCNGRGPQREDYMFFGYAHGFSRN